MKHKLTKERIVRIGRDIKNHAHVKDVGIIVKYKDGTKVHYCSEFDGDKAGNW